MNCFKIISEGIAATSIADSVHCYPPHEVVRDVIIEMSLNEHWFSVIRDESKIYGYLALDGDYDDTLCCAEAAEPIDGIISSSTSLLDVIPLFKNHFFYFILDKDQFSRVISFRHLDRLPAQMCIMSLIMHLEHELYLVLSTDPEKYVKFLSPGRVEKCRELVKLKEIKDSYVNLLQCSYFADKAKMVYSDPYLLGMLPFFSKGDCKKFFSLVQEVRNEIAHSGSLLAKLPDPQIFDTFISATQYIIESIQDF